MHNGVYNLYIYSHMYVYIVFVRTPHEVYYKATSTRMLSTRAWNTKFKYILHLIGWIVRAHTHTQESVDNAASWNFTLFWCGMHIYNCLHHGVVKHTFYMYIYILILYYILHDLYCAVKFLMRYYTLYIIIFQCLACGFHLIAVVLMCELCNLMTFLQGWKIRFVQILL